MSTVSASAPAASASSTSAPASVVLAFRGESADVGFPWAGAALLLVLVAVAFAVRWFTQRHGGIPSGLLARLAQRPLRPPHAEGVLCVTDSVRLDAHTVLHAVQWQGRMLLVATSATCGPVVLDRTSRMANAAEAEA